MNAWVAAWHDGNNDFVGSAYDLLHAPTSQAARSVNDDVGGIFIRLGGIN
jgi:hypothetical protein